MFEPKLMPSINEVVHFESESYIVTCDSNGARVRWFDPNNQFVDPVNRSRVHVEERNGESALIFTSILPEDKGNWTCQAENNPHRVGFNMIVYSKIVFCNTKRLSNLYLNLLTYSSEPIQFVDSQNVQSVRENDDAVIKVMN